MPFDGPRLVSVGGDVAVHPYPFDASACTRPWDMPGPSTGCRRLGDGGERRALGANGGVGSRGEVSGVGGGDRGQLGEEPVEALAWVDLAAEAGADEGVE